MEDEKKTAPKVENALLNEELDTKKVDIPEAESASEKKPKKPRKTLKKKLITEGTSVKRIKLYVRPGGMRNFESDNFKITESKDRLTVTVEYLKGPRKGTTENYSMSDAVSVDYK